MNREYARAEHFPLKAHNTMGIASFANEAFFPYTVRGCRQVFEDLDVRKPIILGKGSNTVFQHERVEVPLLITDMLRNIEFYNETIICDCGVSLSKLSWFALSHNRTGFEFLEDIPGAVGGGLCMNAGTYEDTIGNLVESVLIYDTEKKEIKTIQRDELSSGWGKRDSCFQHRPWFIIQCCFRAGEKKEYEHILSEMLEIKKKRYLKQPRDYPSAGSVFKRPYVNGEPKYVWKLLDEAGLRGYRIGGAQVSEKHPGFIVNVGNASGQNVVDLMNCCKNTVKNIFGIEIEEEWKIV